MQTFFYDIRRGVRLLLRQPALLTAASLALMLGVGLHFVVSRMVESAFHPLACAAQDHLCPIIGMRDTGLCPAAGVPNHGE